MIVVSKFSDKFLIGVRFDAPQPMIEMANAQFEIVGFSNLQEKMKQHNRICPS